MVRPSRIALLYLFRSMLKKSTKWSKATSWSFSCLKSLTPTRMILYKSSLTFHASRRSGSDSTSQSCSSVCGQSKAAHLLAWRASESHLTTQRAALSTCLTSGSILISRMERILMKMIFLARNQLKMSKMIKRTTLTYFLKTQNPPMEKNNQVKTQQDPMKKDLQKIMVLAQERRMTPRRRKKRQRREKSLTKWRKVPSNPSIGLSRTCEERGRNSWNGMVTMRKMVLNPSLQSITSMRSVKRSFSSAKRCTLWSCSQGTLLQLKSQIKTSSCEDWASRSTFQVLSR